MKKAPCRNCPKRIVTSEYNCHSHCPEFDEYVEDRLKYRNYNNGNSADYMSYQSQIIQKRIKEKNEKNRT